MPNSDDASHASMNSTFGSEVLAKGPKPYNVSNLLALVAGSVRAEVCSNIYHDDVVKLVPSAGNVVAPYIHARDNMICRTHI